MPDDSPNVALFARGPDTNPMGKCTQRLACDVPDLVYEHFVAMAAMRGQRSAEYLRNIITNHLYGEFQAARMKVTGVRPDSEG